MHDYRRDLFRLAWPASLAMVVHSLYRLNDQYFVQDLGVEAQSAVAVGGMVVIWFMAFAQMVATGTLAVAARRFGEGDDAAARVAIRSGARAALVVGAALAAGSMAAMPSLCEVLIRGEGAELERQHAYDYMMWIAGGQLVIAILPTLDAAFFARKDTRTPMQLQCMAIVANAILNWQLVPVMGVAGAGLGTVVSRSLALAVGVVLLRRGGITGLWTGLTRGPVIRRILAIGLPTCLAIGIYSAVYQVILAVTFPHFGADGRSALGIAFGIESVFFCFFWGIGTAVAALVGRALGEGAPERAEAVARTAARASLVIGVLTSVSFWTLGPWMIGVFSDDAGAVATNIDYLAILAWAQPFQALQVIYEQTLIGAGCTLPTMIATSTMNIARIPLAHALAVWAGWGLAGIWWAVNLSSLGKYVWARLLFARGGWKQTRV